jgi:hypothetical protein
LQYKARFDDVRTSAYRADGRLFGAVCSREILFDLSKLLQFQVEFGCEGESLAGTGLIGGRAVLCIHQATAIPPSGTRWVNPSSVTADGAYDTKHIYDAIINHSADVAIVIPPRINAVEAAGNRSPGQRDRHIAAIRRDGRMKWQASTCYGKRVRVETAIGRYKSIIRPRLRARSFHAQQTEVAIGCAVLNRMLTSARPKSVRRKAKVA